MNPEQALIDSFRLIELKYAGLLGTPGADANQSKARITARLRELADAPDVQEFQCSARSTWEELVLHSVLKRYGIQPYRYHKQRRSTILVRVSKQFMDELLWPIYIDISQSFSDRLSEIARAVLPEIAPGPFSLPIMKHDHAAGSLCADCQERLKEKPGAVLSE